MDGRVKPGHDEDRAMAPPTKSASSDTALVLFSGGQDSTVCLAWALERFARVETVGFDYGQRHVIEMDVRARVRTGMAALNPKWKARLGELQQSYQSRNGGAGAAAGATPASATVPSLKAAVPR